MKYKQGVIAVLSFLFFVLPQIAPVRAEYVLPYPSYMPGNKLYRVSRVLDRMGQYWNFGNIAKFKYRLQLADKYLIEAKTLFEYKQYLLASDALARSDAQFTFIPDSIRGAQRSSIDTTILIRTLHEAAEKHKEVLNVLLKNTPESFYWTPEKTAATDLPIAELLQSSLEIRQNILEFKR